MAEIFISYASQDRDFAKNLADALEEEGWSTWWDRTILPGKTFDEAIQNALDNAAVVLVLWSCNSISSDWVKEEIADAARNGTLVPALIENVAIPLGFRRYQAADLSRWEMDVDDPEYRNMVVAIRDIIGQPRRQSVCLETRSKEPDRDASSKRKWTASQLSKSGIWDTEILIQIKLSKNTHLLKLRERNRMIGRTSWHFELNGENIGMSAGAFTDQLYFEIHEGIQTYDAEIKIGVFGGVSLSVGGKKLL